MTKKENDDSKRRITIEDKRGQDQAQEPEGSVSSQAQPEMDDKLLKLVDSAIDDQAEGAAEPVSAEAPSGQPDYPPMAEGDVPWPQRAMEYLELARRKEAELQNYRKRVQKDMENARRYAVEALLADLFPALDGLTQAGLSFSETSDDESALLDGVRRTIKSLEAALSKHGIEKINQAPVPFDPQLHQALNVETSNDFEVDTVAEVYVEGYRLGETVLKPAMVRVVKPEQQA